uniref:Short-chain dehydrogenase reductase sdr family protein n=1 Tax=Melanopsichium pennsylvanicum 4 TaxID=1398559 RepID=A0A077R767_9BASI|nr:short-chain dehydrogenase reductase sdr family protein [Melanopsichium pennsylvanicum 4]
MSNKKRNIMHDIGSPRKNRIDLLNPDFTPHAPVKSLGQDLLHGPRIEDHVVIILGVGPGLGLSIAQVFASRGYITAILSRTKSRLESWSDSLHETALAFRKANNLRLTPSERLSAAFACDALDNESVKLAVEKVSNHWKDKKIGTACYNASIRKRGPFLEQRLEQLKDGVQGSILAGFTFAQAVVGKMEAHGLGGSLIVTGATSSTRGREGFAGFAASIDRERIWPSLHSCEPRNRRRPHRVRHGS